MENIKYQVFQKMYMFNKIEKEMRKILILIQGTSDLFKTIKNYF